MKKVLFISLLLLTVVFSSCTDEVGGNADISTVDFTVRGSEWVEYGTYGEQDYGFVIDMSFPEITDNVIQNGMVSLYIKAGDAWIPVPVYFYHASDQNLYEGGYFYRMRRGVFSIDYYESDFYTQNPGLQNFRLVIVQPI